MIILNRSKRIDWPRVVANLRATGMSVQQIADEVDVGRSSLQGYCDEALCSEPSFWVGSRLLLIWTQRTGLPYFDAPTRTVQASVSAVLRSTA